MRPLALAALALMLPQADESAEAAALFQKFEKAFQESKGVSFNFETTIETGGDPHRLQGRVRLATPNKARLEISGMLGVEEFVVAIVSDGTTIQVTRKGRAKRLTVATPKDFNEQVIARFTRRSAAHLVRGFYESIVAMSERKAGDGLGTFPPAERAFHMRAGDYIGQAVLRFPMDDRGRHTVELWLDKENFRPTKRTLESAETRRKTAEKYTGMDLAAEFADDEFKLGKK